MKYSSCESAAWCYEITNAQGQLLARCHHILNTNLQLIVMLQFFIILLSLLFLFYFSEVLVWLSPSLSAVLHYHLLVHVKIHWRVRLNNIQRAVSSIKRGRVAVVELGSGLLLSDSSVLNFMSIQDCAVGVCLFNPALRVRACARVRFHLWPRKDAVEWKGRSLHAPWNGKISVCHCWLPLCQRKSSIFFPFFQPASSIQGRRGVLE